METFEIKIKHPKSISPILFDSFKLAVEILVGQHNQVVKKEVFPDIMLQYFPTIAINEINNDILKLNLKLEKIDEKYLNETMNRLIKTINRMARVGAFELG